MYKMKKDGVVRIVATEAEKARWEALGYKSISEPSSSDGGADEADALADMDTDALKKYAADNGIDIGNSTSQNGILKKIRDAQTAKLKEE